MGRGRRSLGYLYCPGRSLYSGIDFFRGADAGDSDTESCGDLFPFFIEEDLKTEKQYFNPSSIRLIKENEISILRRCEYEEKLKKVIADKCIHCVNYIDDVCEQDFKSHIEHIDLNGECYGFETKK